MSSVTHAFDRSGADPEFAVARRDDPSVTGRFRFSENRWLLLDILSPHQPDGYGTFGFENVPEWLRDEAKRYILHLWREVGANYGYLVSALVGLRYLGRYLPEFAGTPSDLRRRDALAFVRNFGAAGYSSTTYGSAQTQVNRFARFLRDSHPEVREMDFQVAFPKHLLKQKSYTPLGKDESEILSTELKAQVLEACAADERAYYQSRNGQRDPSAPGLRDLLSRAIKAQVIKLGVCVGRRAGALVQTLEAVLIEPAEIEAEDGQTHEGVWIRFRERKLQQIDEDIFCPAAYAEIAVHAVETARSLTSELRRDNPAWAEYLFLVPGKGRKSARVVSVATMNAYLCGRNREPKRKSEERRQKTDFPGLLERNGIDGRVTTHVFRATRATNLWMGGMEVHEVAYDLSHVSANMTIRHYIAGTRESKRRFEEEVEAGAIGDALAVMLGDGEVVRAKLSRRHVEIMQRQGRVLRPTRYGYCALPGSSGPCPTGNPCYVGPNGSGCDHHLLSPGALPALEEDREVVEFNLLTYAEVPDYRAFVENQQIQLAVIRSKIGEATLLKDRLVAPGKQPADALPARLSRLTEGHGKETV